MVKQRSLLFDENKEGIMPDLKPLKIDSEPIRHRVYMRDWYFNAGIVGFLEIISDGKDLETIEGLTVGENYIEFENQVLDGFEEKFEKKAFLYFFRKGSHLNKIEEVLKEIEDVNDPLKTKKTKVKILRNDLGAINFELFKAMKGDFLQNDDLDKLLNDFENIKKIISKKTSLEFYDYLKSSDDRLKFLDYFLGIKFKGLATPNTKKLGLLKLKIDKIDYEKKIKNNEYCLSCQLRKASEDFDNSISNIIGFNKRNKNWVWGYQVTKNNLCPICSIIYLSAFNSLTFVLKKIDNNFLNNFYFVNYNNSILSLYKQVLFMKQNLSVIENKEDPFFIIIKNILSSLRDKNIKSIKENINFIEIMDNPVLQGQSTKGYNLYNYNINYETATFLKNYIDGNNKLYGFFKVKDDYYNLEEEVIKKTILNQISYSLLNNYFLHYNKKISKFSIYNTTKYILNYLNYFLEDNMKENREKIIKKAFGNGKQLRDILKSNDKLNQLDGLVYSFLNDLKISNKEKFLDKYIRMMMSHKLGVRFGLDEMQDKDSFLQFGYSFVNGLLYKEYKRDDNNNSNGGKHE